MHKCATSPIQTSIKFVNQIITSNNAKLINKSTISIILKLTISQMAKCQTAMTNNNQPVLNYAKFCGNEQIMRLRTKAAAWLKNL